MKRYWCISHFCLPFTSCVFRVKFLIWNWDTDVNQRQEVQRKVTCPRWPTAHGALAVWPGVSLWLVVSITQPSPWRASKSAAGYGSQPAPPGWRPPAGQLHCLESAAAFDWPAVECIKGHETIRPRLESSSLCASRPVVLLSLWPTSHSAVSTSPWPQRHNTAHGTQSTYPCSSYAPNAACQLCSLEIMWIVTQRHFLEVGRKVQSTNTLFAAGFVKFLGYFIGLYTFSCFCDFGV